MSPEPDPIAALDQLRAATRDFAKQAAAFYKDLIEEGIPAEAAAAMPNGYVQSMVIASGIFGQQQEDE